MPGWEGGSSTRAPRTFSAICLLYEEAGRYVLHEMLKADARQHRWLSDAQEADTHRALASAYRARFSERHASPAQMGMAMVEEFEAFHHASQCNDEEATRELQAFFVDQLDAGGKALSVQWHDYASAASVFKRALSWDPNDDYAHHYYAFNLDVDGREPQAVEDRAPASTGLLAFALGLFPHHHGPNE